MTEGRRIIVCGGRDYDDSTAVCYALERVHAEKPIAHMFHGNARGADQLCARWASLTAGVRVHAVPAQWAKYGRRAGPIRNQHMLGQGVDLVVAFPGGMGTADMVRRAKKAGVPVIEVPAR